MTLTSRVATRDDLPEIRPLMDAAVMTDTAARSAAVRPDRAATDEDRPSRGDDRYRSRLTGPRWPSTVA